MVSSFRQVAGPNGRWKWNDQQISCKQRISLSLRYEYLVAHLEIWVKIIIAFFLTFTFWMDWNRFDRFINVFISELNMPSSLTYLYSINISLFLQLWSLKDSMKWYRFILSMAVNQSFITTWAEKVHVHSSDTLFINQQPDGQSNVDKEPDTSPNPYQL